MSSYPLPPNGSRCTIRTLERQLAAISEQYRELSCQNEALRTRNNVLNHLCRLTRAAVQVVRHSQHASPNRVYLLVMEDLQEVLARNLEAASAEAFLQGVDYDCSPDDIAESLDRIRYDWEGLSVAETLLDSNPFSIVDYGLLSLLLDPSQMNAAVQQRKWAHRSMWTYF